MPGLINRITPPSFQLIRWFRALLAVADGQCALILSGWPYGEPAWEPRLAIPVAVMSFGLFGFGAALNDIVDHRRDQYLDPDRPLGSGRISLPVAKLLCGLMLIMGLAGGIVHACQAPHGIVRSFFMIWAIILIIFYNFAGKFLGAPGMLTLGLIRFFHAAVAQPKLTVIWHPLLLLNHVTLLAMAGHELEDKRPHLTKAQRWTTLGGLVLLNLFLVSGVWLATFLTLKKGADISQAMGLDLNLLMPLGAAAVFAVAARWYVRRQPVAGEVLAFNAAITQRRHSAGRRLVIVGLLWMLIYDAAFILGYVQ